MTSSTSTVSIVKRSSKAMLQNKLNIFIELSNSNYKKKGNLKIKCKLSWNHKIVIKLCLKVVIVWITLLNSQILANTIKNSKDRLETTPKYISFPSSDISHHS